MKKLLLCGLLLTGVFATTKAQDKMVDYKTKTTQNATERTAILDVVRQDMMKQKYPEFVFVVNHLKVQKNYAFFRGDATLKSGKPYKTKPEEDCCHVEYLLKKENGSWKVVEGQAFSTDVWWACLWKTHSLPLALFGLTVEGGCE